MSKRIIRTATLTYLIGLSFLGWFVVGMLSLYPPVSYESFVWRKPLVGSIFSLICVLGILAVFFPKQCSGKFDLVTKGDRGQSTPHLFASHGASLNMSGHHRDCENFSFHVFRIGNRTFCTACTGLLLGGLASIIGTLLYFFAGWQIEHGLLIVWIGLIGVGFGLFQFKARRTAIRLSLNTFFVLGTCLVLVGVDELAQNVFADVFLVLLTVFWLYTRILLSQWDHKRICYVCGVSTCELTER